MVIFRSYDKLPEGTGIGPPLAETLMTLSAIWGWHWYDLNHFHPQRPQGLLNYVPSPAALCIDAYFAGMIISV